VRKTASACRPGGPRGRWSTPNAGQDSAASAEMGTVGRWKGPTDHAPTWWPRWRCNRPTPGPSGSSPHKSDAAKGDEMKGRRHVLQGDWRVAVVVLLLWASCSSASDAIEVKPSQAQLFLDDFVVEKME